jgi:hypothetical protein
MEKKFTVADILSTSANNNVLCHLYDEVHQVNESATEAEISDNACQYGWATATVNYWHVTEEGNLEFNAELQNYDATRAKYLEIAEDLSMIRDAAQQEIRDIKSLDGPLTEDDRNKIANIRKAKVRVEYFITVTNMAANKKAVITPLGWLNMLAVCEFIRDIDIFMLNVLLRDVMDIYAPSFKDLKFADCIQPSCEEAGNKEDK